jgi:hypothetical protein
MSPTALKQKFRELKGNISININRFDLCKITGDEYLKFEPLYCKVVKLLVGGRGEISAKHKLIFKYKNTWFLTLEFASCMT